MTTTSAPVNVGSTATEESESPWGGLLPKVETQAGAFISENPQCDGRGVIVGVLDTGVDPGAIGLQRTSDGKVKVVDVIDCTGSGDVAMGPPVGCIESESTTESSGEFIQGASGRKIKINTAWQNPTGKYRVGMKRLFELYPGGLKKRVVMELKKSWDKQQAQAEHALQIAIAAATGDSAATATANAGDDDVSVEDLKVRLSTLKSMCEQLQSGNADCGPIVDCLVFHDGEKWVAAVKVGIDPVLEEGDSGLKEGVFQEEGYVDMSSIEPMAEYRVAQQYRRLTDLDALNYCVNIFDDGAVLSLCVDSGAHGTHVAGIIAAYHPDQPECNGVAPGAQIVSLKIGDSRLGSMETGVGFTRALIEAVRRGCHVINMSFGEACTVNNAGEFIKLAEEVVHTHNIVYVGSAGNNGPCISTVGAPCGTSSAVLSVGAMVTKSMMTAAYSMLQDVPPTNFTWSSVGPTTDGDFGVSILAPGGAITSVPNWTLNKKQLMNGTSMSSPNAAGCVALLVSATKYFLSATDTGTGTGNPPHAGLKDTVTTKGTLVTSGGTFSAARYLHAVTRSAQPQPGVHVLGQHWGLIQVQQAWAHILAHAGDSSLDIPIEATVVGDARFKRGIYLRQPQEVSALSAHKVELKPRFRDDAPPESKFNYEMRLKVESSVPSLVKCPECVELLRSGRVIDVAVDPSGLSEGVHVAFVRCYDQSNPDKGPICEIPVTIVVPLVIDPNSSDDTAINSSGTGSGTGTDNDTGSSNTSSKGVVCNHYNRASRELCLPAVSLKPCERLRKFIVPPVGCTAIEATIIDKRSNSDSTAAVRTDTKEDSDQQQQQAAVADGASKLVVLHAVQLFNQIPYRDNEKEVYIRLKPQSQHTVSWPVTAGATMELCLARYWSTLGDDSTVQCEVQLAFKGICAVPSSLTLHGGSRVSELVRLYSPLAAVEVSPMAKLDKLQSTVAPSARGQVLPLGERDILPDNSPLYQLVLSYGFEVAEAAAGSATSVTPRWPLLNTVLYESPVHAQFYMLYEAKSKTLLATGDAWPSAVPVVAASARIGGKLGIAAGGGSYTMRLQVRHRDTALLEKLQCMPMVLEYALKSPVKLTCYRNQVDAIAGVSLDGSLSLQPGVFQHLLFAEPSAEQLPKCSNGGDVLLGSVTYLRNPNNSSNGSNNNCLKGEFPLRFIAATHKDPPAPTTSGSAAAASGKSETEQSTAEPSGAAADTTTDTQRPSAAAKKAEEKLTTALRDARLKFLESMVGTSDTVTVTDTNNTSNTSNTSNTAAAASTGEENLFDHYLATLLKDFDSHLPVHMLHLRHQAKRATAAVATAVKSSNSSSSTSTSAPSSSSSAASDITTAVKCLDNVLEVAADISQHRIDKTAVAVELGQLVDKDPGSAAEKDKLAQQRKSREKERDSLVEALAAAATALIDRRRVLMLLATAAQVEVDGFDAQVEVAKSDAEFEKSYAELRRWKDITKTEAYWRIQVHRLQQQNRLGAALQRVNEVIEKGSNGGSDKEELLMEQQKLLTALGWLHLKNRARTRTFLSTNTNFQPF